MALSVLQVLTQRCGHVESERDALARLSEGGAQQRRQVCTLLHAAGWSENCRCAVWQPRCMPLATRTLLRSWKRCCAHSCVARLTEQTEVLCTLSIQVAHFCHILSGSCNPRPPSPKRMLCAAGTDVGPSSERQLCISGRRCRLGQLAAAVEQSRDDGVTAVGTAVVVVTCLAYRL